jgi:cytoskeletal protein CcmA (bactofilin family)
MTSYRFTGGSVAHALRPAQFFDELSVSPVKKLVLAWASFGILVPAAAASIGFGLSAKFAVIGMVVLALPFQYLILSISRATHHQPADEIERAQEPVQRVEDSPRFSAMPGESAAQINVAQASQSSEPNPALAAVRSSEATSFARGINISGINIQGEVSGEQDVVLAGRVQGAIILKGHTLTVGPTATVTANVIAGRVVVSGKIIGNIAAGTVEVRRSAVLEGNVICEKIIIEDGAFFHGAVDIRKGAATFAAKAMEEHRAERELASSRPKA